MKKPSKKTAIVKSFVSYYRYDVPTFVADMLCAFVYALGGLCYPMLSRPILNTYIPGGDTKHIVIFCAALLGVYVVRTLTDYFVCYYGHSMGVRMQARMRTDLFAHLQRLPYSYYDNTETGQLMSRMTNDLFNVSELAHHGPENLFITSFVTIGAFVYLCTISWKLSLIIFAFLPLMFVITHKARRDQRRAFTKSKEAIGDVNAVLENSLSGVRTTKAFGNDGYEERKFDQVNREFIKARSLAYKAMGFFHSTMGFVTSLYNVVVLVAGALFCVYDESFDYADLMVFMLSINLFLSPIQTLVNFFEQLEDGATGYKRFYEIMQVPVEEDQEGAEDLGEVAGDIRFEHVSFRYREGRRLILDDLSLHVPAGKTYALVGASGGGKTTLCHLLPKFYPLGEGMIYIDDKPLNQITNRSIRDKIGIVQQSVFLFTGTFRDNIAYGRPDATEEEILEAARRAHIYDFIMEQPKGLDTPIGERGVQLSGGQQQRLSIARIFLKNPPILILDEATSALDNATEALIQSALNDLAEGRTSIVVAHRLTTVRDADCIVVIDRGHIMEQGTHAELMERKGVYYDLYTSAKTDMIDCG